MNKTYSKAALCACLAISLGIAIGCSDQLVEPSGTESALISPQSPETGESGTLSKKGPPLSATVEFGRNELGSPFPPPDGHDASTHAKDALQPRTVVISAGGNVTFSVAPFHKIAIYNDGTKPGDIDVTLLESANLPFEFPPIINDDTNRIIRGDLVLPGPAVDFNWTFEEPGRYLVICEVLPHFAFNNMYGWVIVK